MSLLKIVTRLLAFVGKELVEVARRPGALVSLVLGPFLIMAVFGFGYGGVRSAFRTIVVVPPDSGLATDVESYRRLATEGVTIEDVVADPETARARLRDGTADLIVIAPPNVRQRFQAGEQSTITIEYAMADPVRASYASAAGRQISAEVNREIIRRAAEDGGTYALSTGAGTAPIPPDVIAAPTRAEDHNLAPTAPGVVPYYAPALIALVLQHLALSLVALSLVRERTTGVAELFRVSPISVGEVLVGKLLAFLVLGGLVAVATFALVAGPLGVPMLGPLAAIAGVVLLLLVAATAIGLLIATISDSERQAVQLALLVLLASIFFSGIVVPVTDFIPPVQALAWTLPVTHAIALLQQLMLFGWTTTEWQALALGVIGAVALLLAWVLLGRSMRRA